LRKIIGIGGAARSCRALIWKNSFNWWHRLSSLCQRNSFVVSSRALACFKDRGIGGQYLHFLGLKTTRLRS
jgi:hypothetical protein